MSEDRLRKIGWKPLAALGLCFGVGFTAGFLSGFEYGFSDYERAAVSASEARSADVVPALRDEATEPEPLLSSDRAEVSGDDDDDETAIEDSEFALTEHSLGDDENGLFISGTVVNQSQSAFDAVRVSFELCDTKGNMYSTVSDLTDERMEPGDSWGFTVYIPYAEMRQFHSYRLQGIMGVRK